MCCICADLLQSVLYIPRAVSVLIFYSLCCISPVLAARTIPGCTVTVGQDKDVDGTWPYAGTAGACQSMGAQHINKEVTVSFRLIPLKQEFCFKINLLLHTDF